MRIGAAVIAILLMNGLLLAQPTSQPSSFPSFGSMDLQPMSGSGGAPEPLKPAVYPIAPNYDGDWVTPASGPSNLLRDGAYIVRRPGTFARSADGRTWEFTPDPVVMSTTQPSQIMLAAAPTTAPTTGPS